MFNDKKTLEKIVAHVRNATILGHTVTLDTGDNCEPITGVYIDSRTLFASFTDKICLLDRAILPPARINVHPIGGGAAALIAFARDSGVLAYCGDASGVATGAGPALPALPNTAQQPITRFMAAMVKILNQRRQAGIIDLEATNALVALEDFISPAA